MRARRWATRLVVAALAASVLSGNSFRIDLPVPPDRVLLAAGIGLLVLSGAHRTAGRLRWRLVHVLMLATVVWTAWSALTHGTLTTSYGAYALLDRILVPFALFALAPLLFPEEADRRILAKMLVLLGLYLGATAIFEMTGLDALVFPRYILDPDVGILYGRARGPSVSADANGLALAACLFASVLAATRLRGPWRAAAVLAAPLTAVGILLTLTRSIWLGLLLGIVLVAVLVPGLRKVVALAATASAATLAAVLASLPAFTQTLVDRLTTERSVFDRQNTNAAALRAALEHPIDGIGWVRYLSESADWVRQADTYPVTNIEIEVHNVILSRAAELGFVGAALWVGCVLAGPGLGAFRRTTDPALADWRAVLIGYAGVWGVAIMLSPVPYVLANDLLWVAAGIVLRDQLLDHGERDPLAGARAAP